MRKIFVIACFLLIYGAAFGQLSQFRMIGSGSWSTVNDSTFSSTVTIQSDLTGNGFLPTGITDSMLIFSQTGQRYTISSAINLTFSSADLTIIESGGDWGTPVGQVMIYEDQGRQTVPSIPFGATTGATAKMQEAIGSYNSTLIIEGVTATELADSTSAVRADFPTGGGNTTGSNLGAGTGLFAQKSSEDLQFKSLIEGTGVSFSSTPTEVTINASSTGATEGTPTGYADTLGNTGDFYYDDNYIHVKTVKGWKRSRLELSQWDAPTLFVLPVDNDTIILSWTGEGATEYIIERALRSDFQDSKYLAKVDSSTTSYTDGGLDESTTYYYRIKSKKTDFQDSPWTSGNGTTLFTPVAWYDAIGLPDIAVLFPAQNKYGYYGASTGTSIDTMYSFFTSAPPLVRFPGAPSPSILLQQNQSSGPTLGTAGTSFYYVQDSIMKFEAGQDFTIACVLYAVDDGGLRVNTLFRDSLDNYMLDFRQTSLIAREQDLTNNSIAYPDGTWKEGLSTEESIHKLVFQREADTLRVSVDGGLNYFSYDNPSISGNTYDYRKLGGGDDFERLMFDTSVLSKPQLDVFFNYPSTGNYIEDDTREIEGFTGLTFNDFSYGYYVNDSLSTNPTGSQTRDVVYSINGKTVILSHLKYASPYYGEDLYLVLDHVETRLSDPVFIGVPTNDDDVHNNGAIMPFGNKMLHFESSVHYDQSAPNGNYVVIKTTGDNYNFSSISEIRQRDVAPSIFYDAQYSRPMKLGNSIYSVMQQYNGSSNPKAILGKSEDFGFSWTKETLADVTVSGENNWLYFSSVYNEEDTMRVVLEYLSQDSVRHLGVYYLESVDGCNFSNLAETKTFNICDNRPIVRDSLDYFAIDTCYNNTGSIRTGFWNYDVDEDELYSIIGDGSGDSLQFVYGVGGTWNYKTIDFGDSTIITSVIDPNNSPVIIKRSSNTYDAYVHGQGSGGGTNWNVIHYRTTDKGENWTFQSKLTTDDSSKHKRLNVTKNAEYADNIILVAGRENSTGVSGNSDLWIYDISDQ